MDCTLADSVLHLNDGNRGHARIISQIGLDVGTVGMFSQIYCWVIDSHRICVRAWTSKND